MAIVRSLVLILTQSDFCFKWLPLAANLRTDCRGKDGRKDPVRRLCRRPECGLDRCDSGGDVVSGQFLDMFKGRAIKPSPQIKCTETERI